MKSDLQFFIKLWLLIISKNTLITTFDFDTTFLVMCDQKQKFALMLFLRFKIRPTNDKKNVF